jgi:hypothetical protein
MTRFLFSITHYLFYSPDDSSRPKVNQLSGPSSSGGGDSTGENALLNPLTNSNMILIYENNLDLDNAIATYLNEGLRRGQLCVHASVSLANQRYLENFSSRILNYNENIECGNLKLVDLATYYVNAMIGNLESFNSLKKEIISIVHQDKNRIDKHIRVTEDCATLLFKNKHLNECISVKEWCRGNPLGGSYLCPYPKSLLNRFPFNANITRVIHDHDILIDSKGKVISSY